MDIVELLGEAPAGAPDDILLAREAAAGNGAAFVCLYDRYAQRAFTFCHRLLGTRGQAAYAIEQSFARVASQLAQIKRVGNHDFRMQLYSAAHGASYSVLAAAERRRHPAPTTSDLTSDAEHQGGLSVSAAHSALAPQQREVLALRELEGMTCAQIASVADIDAGMAARSIADARINLFELLTPGVSPVTSQSADCRRSLTLLALCEDPGGVAAEQCAWLANHLSACAACATNEGRVRSGTALYRTLPWPEPVEWLRHSTIQTAAHALGVNWQAEAPAPPRVDSPTKAVVPLLVDPIGRVRSAFATATHRLSPQAESLPDLSTRARALLPDRFPGGQAVWGGVAACALGVLVAVALLGSGGQPARKAQLPIAPPPPATFATQPPPSPIEAPGTSSTQDTSTGQTDQGSTSVQTVRRANSQTQVSKPPPAPTTNSQPQTDTNTSTDTTEPTTTTPPTTSSTPTHTNTQPPGNPGTGTTTTNNNGPAADAGWQAFDLASLYFGQTQPIDPPQPGTDPTQTSTDPTTQATTSTDTGATTTPPAQ